MLSYHRLRLHSPPLFLSHPSSLRIPLALTPSPSPPPFPLPSQPPRPTHHHLPPNVLYNVYQSSSSINAFTSSRLHSFPPVSCPFSSSSSCFPRSPHAPPPRRPPQPRPQSTGPRPFLSWQRSSFTSAEKEPGSSEDNVMNLMKLTASFAEEPVDAGPKEGPMRLYLQGIKSGSIRPDLRQEVTMDLLQSLYNDVRKRFPTKSRKGSGLTVVDAASPVESKPWSRSPPPQLSAPLASPPHRLVLTVPTASTALPLSAPLPSPSNVMHQHVLCLPFMPPRGCQATTRLRARQGLLPSPPLAAPLSRDITGLRSFNGPPPTAGGRGCWG